MITMMHNCLSLFITTVKVYDPHFMSHCFEGVSQWPWAQTAEIQAAEQWRQNVPFEFDFLEQPEDEDKVGWEECYFQQADMAASRKIASYNKLSPLQGQGVTKCFGSGTLNLPDHPISPCMLILEYLLNIQSLKKVETKLITPQIIDSLKETATTFGWLGVAHCDLNYSNIFFLVGDEGISCAVIIDFGSSCTWEQEQLDEEWASVIEDQDDVLWLEQRLARMIKERP